SAPLKNPGNDAAEIKRRFDAIGFDEVVRATDLDKAGFERALLAFARKARGADTAVIYYSGHGLEVGGRNFLVPLGADIAHPNDAQLLTVPLDSLTKAASGAKRLAVVIIDACRDNPWAGVKGAKGLARVDVSKPRLVLAYSTAPGKVAEDGAGRLSPYTQALSELLAKSPGLDVRVLFTALGDRTDELSRGPQSPWASFGKFGAETVALLPGAGKTRPEAAAADPAPRPYAPPRPVAPKPSILGEAPKKLDAKTRALWDRASAGDAKSLAELGDRYRRGHGGLPENPREAVRLFRIAVDKDHPRGRVYLGEMYEFGQGGLKQDDKAALRLYRLAAAEEDPIGQYRLGRMYERGKGGVRGDEKRAERLYERAVKQGYLEAGERLRRFCHARDLARVSSKWEKIPIPKTKGRTSLVEMQRAFAFASAGDECNKQLSSLHPLLFEYLEKKRKERMSKAAYAVFDAVPLEFTPVKYKIKEKKKGKK
ncbi:MAG: caspase family protein, partial [Neomegalonema sp.]|nr:caspase family protein [Neomegalonema sp.]